MPQQQPPPWAQQFPAHQTFPGMPYGYPPQPFYARVPASLLQLARATTDAHRRDPRRRPPPPQPQPVQQDSSLLQFQMMQLQQQQQQQRFDEQLRRFKEETARQAREAVETLRRENAQLLTEVQRLKERHVTPKSSRRPKTPVRDSAQKMTLNVTRSRRWRCHAASTPSS